MIANISEVKAHFSRMVERAYHGETVVIAKNGTPLVDLVPHQPSRPRKLGLLAGQFKSRRRAFFLLIFPDVMRSGFGIFLSITGIRLTAC